MDKNSVTIALEKFIVNWNVEFPDNPMTAADLTKPHSVMSALFLLFNRLGIDTDAILAPPPEECRNEHLVYYWDLLPVINMTRVINHLSFIKESPVTACITHFLQPIAIISHTMLLFLFNLMIFNEQRLREIQPYEEVLFSNKDQGKVLEEKKNALLTMLNEQAVEKGKRAERCEKLDNETQQFEEELRVEKEAYDEEQQELEAMLKENKQIDMNVELKKGHRDGLLAEIEKKRALRVYDADDIKVQAEQAAQNVQDAEEKLKSLRETLMQKENSLKNLQTIKPNLDVANTLLHEIVKLSDSLRDHESGDLDTDSKEGELDVLNTEIGELEVQLAELQAARAEAAEQRQEAHARRQQEQTLAQRNVREAEEKDKKCRERCARAAQRAQEVKDLTATYEREKAEGLEELARIQKSFALELKSMEDSLLKKTIEVKKYVEAKLRNRCV